MSHAILRTVSDRFVAWSLVAVLAVAACSASGSPTPAPESASAPPSIRAGAPPSPATSVRAIPLRMVVLGDGYGAGLETSAPNRESWPAQLQQISRHTDTPIRLVANLATRGQTSYDVLADQLPLVASHKPDLVAVQVGVNDIVATRTSLDDYRANVDAILAGLLEIVPGRQVYVLTTPDHRLTRFGREELPGTTDVSELNRVLREVASKRGAIVIDIAPVYDLVVEDPTFVASDGFPYPTARQYAGWAELIGQRISRTLSASEP